VIFNETVSGDVVFSVFSVLFVCFYLGFHLKSVFMSFYSITMILMSFPVTQIIYSGALQIEFYTTLNQLAIFIVLGIAADDIFVFHDAWV